VLLIPVSSNATRGSFRFGQLLKLAKEFGLKSLREEWTTLTSEFPSETFRVEVEVSRIVG
jgi:hypothetical protein